MANLMTAGLTDSLLTAFSRVKLAEKPMTQVSNESQKLNPDMDKLQRCLDYGSDELAKAGDAKNKAAEELEVATQAAREEEKAATEQRLAEKATRPNEVSPSVRESDKATSDKAIDSEASTAHTINKDIQDKVELSPETLKLAAERPAPKVVADSPKVYTKTASATSVPKSAAKTPKLDVSV